MVISKVLIYEYIGSGSTVNLYIGRNVFGIEGYGTYFDKIISIH
jgi:hypothetical protein